MSNLKKALSKYDLAAMGEVKQTPIAETHIGFEHFKNIKLSIIDVLTNYPANPIQIQELVRDHLGISEAHIMVTTPGEEANAMPVQPQQALGKDYPKAKTMDLISDLAKNLSSHKSIKYPFAAKSDAKGATTNDLPQGNTSPIRGKVKK